MAHKLQQLIAKRTAIMLSTFELETGFVVGALVIFVDDKCF